MRLLATLAIVLATLAPHAALADGLYSPDDTLGAIEQYSAEFDVSYTWLLSTVRCEAPGFNPYAVGRQGELGAAQLHPRGLLPRFYALGYADPFDPYQAIRFMAQEFSAGRSRAWSCA